MEAVLPKIAEIWPTIIAFIILFVILWRFAFPPITAMLEKRSDTIRESLEKAEQTRIDAEKALEEYKAQIAEARQESGRIVEQGRQVAESMKDEIVAKARAEAEDIVAKAKESIEAEKRAAMADLQQQVANLSVDVAGKVIGKTLSRDDHMQLVQQTLAEVGGLNGK
jgi:F-type H+-transporting ATPase subunit b